MAESVTGATAAGPEIPRESEPEAIADVVSEHEEAATDVAESPVEAAASEPRVPQESVAQAIGDAVPEDREPLSAASANESPDAAETPREAAPFEEYGLDLELLTEPGSGDPPGVPASGEEQDAAVPAAGESAAEAAAPWPAWEDEPEAVADIVSEDEKAATDVAESADEAAAADSEITRESEPEVIGDAALESEESIAASAADDSPDEAVRSHDPEPLEEDEIDLEVSTAPVSDDSPDAPDPSQEDEIASHSEVFAESPPEQTDESPETSPVENGFLPLVRDSRGNWRPGKGFSRSELREAGLTLAGAARLQIRVDKRRRNAHPVNVAALEKAKSGA